MKRRRIVGTLLLIVGLLMTMSSCGSETEKVKKELKGTWSHEWYGIVTGNTCDSYTFSGDSVSFIKESEKAATMIHTGTYEIDVEKQLIVISLDGYENPEYLYYTFEDGRLRLYSTVNLKGETVSWDFEFLKE